MESAVSFDEVASYTECHLQAGIADSLGYLQHCIYNELSLGRMHV